MSEDNIKTKKKDKSFWKSVGGAALAIGGLVAVLTSGKKS